MCFSSLLKRVAAAGIVARTDMSVVSARRAVPLNKLSLNKEFPIRRRFPQGCGLICRGARRLGRCKMPLAARLVVRPGDGPGAVKGVAGRPDQARSPPGQDSGTASL
jgi:hypothetical protein